MMSGKDCNLGGGSLIPFRINLRRGEVTREKGKLSVHPGGSRKQLLEVPQGGKGGRVGGMGLGADACSQVGGGEGR